MKIILVLSASCLLLTSCGSDRDHREADRRTTTEIVSDRPSTSVQNIDRRSNLDPNVYRRSNGDQRVGLAAQDQSESEPDRRITQQARQAIIKRNNLSTNAKNVKIITIERVVQLRGKVDNDVERREIVEIIRTVPGVQRVDEKLEVANKGG